MTLFVTVGTSVLHSYGLPDLTELDALKRDVSDVEDRSEEGEPYSEQRPSKDIRARLCRWHVKHWKDDARFSLKRMQKTSAELSSTLYFLSWNREGRPGRIVLLSSNTFAGGLAADVTKDILVELIKNKNGLLPEECEVVVEIVPDLNREIRNLTASLEQSMRPHATGGGVVNITGGFKGAVPSLTLLAAHHGWRLLYQHETTYCGSLLELPPIAAAGEITVSSRFPTEH